jgi:hypothetical protein
VATSILIEKMKSRHGTKSVGIALAVFPHCTLILPLVTKLLMHYVYFLVQNRVLLQSRQQRETNELQAKFDEVKNNNDVVSNNWGAHKVIVGVPTEQLLKAIPSVDRRSGNIGEEWITTNREFFPDGG